MAGEQDLASDGHAVIGIVRRGLVKDLVRCYSVFIDRAPVGRLWARQSGRYVVAPGHHQVCVRLGRTSMAATPQVELDVHAGEERIFRTGGPRLEISAGSVLMRAPRWHGPWISLTPWPPADLDAAAPSAESAARATRPPGAATVGEVSAARIRDVRFRRVLRGYGSDDVDRFLSQLATRIEHGDAVSAGDLSKATFRQSLKGYDVGEVDGFLEDVARHLAPG